MNRRPVRGRARGDGGFTLVEVLLTVALSATIMGVLASAVMVSMGPDRETKQRVDSTHAAELASMWLPADLASAGPVDPVADLAGSALPTCTGSIAGTNVLRLAWAQVAPTTTSFAVSYRVTTRGTDRQLDRVSCRDGGAARRLTVARGLASSSTPSVTLAGRRVTLRFTTSFGDVVVITGTRRTPDGGPTTTAPTTTTTLPPTTTTTVPPTTTSTSTTTSTTTTLPPTTTTTTAPTTTTTTPAGCTVTSFTLSPTTVARRSGDGHLSSSVSVSLKVSGTCTGPLRIRYAPLWDALGTTTLTLTQSGSSGNWSGTIPGASTTGAETWWAGSHTVTALTGTGATIATTTLVVT